MVKVAPPASRNCLADFFYTVDSASLTGTFTSTSYGTTPATTYEWIFGRVSSFISASEIEYTFDTAGFYNVGLRIQNPITGCASVEYKLINMGMGDQGIKASFAYDIDTSNLKAGGYPVDLVGTASPPKPAKFTWDFGDKKKASGLSTTSRVTHIYAQSGSYIPCFMVEDPQTGEMDEYCQVIAVGSTKVSDLYSSLLLFDNYPNPFSEYTKITYLVSEKMYIELTVLDNLGRELTTLIKTTKNAGTHEFLWDTSELGEGVYYLRLTTSKGLIRTRMLIKK
jgi:PKD repeat protein